MNEINKHLEMVRLFHKAFDYTQAAHNTSEAVAFPDKTRFGRMSFISEELSEILHGIAAEDRVAQLDGVIDLAYLTLGTLAILGENVQDLKGLAKGVSTKTLSFRVLVGGVNEVMHVLCFAEEDAARRDLPEVLSKLYAMCINFCNHYVLADFDGAFEEVQRSNMSKLGADGKPIYNEARKIRKGPDFSEPVLLPFLRGVA